MRNNLRKMLGLAFLAVALTGAALAQTASYSVRANIPFDFYAGDQLMHAGEYTIAVNVDDHIATVGARATGSKIFLLGSPDLSSNDDRAVLTFKLVAGDVYALRTLRSSFVGVSFRAKAPERVNAELNGNPQFRTVVTGTQ